MIKLGLLGHNISYTLSPLVHGNIFSYMGAEGSYDVYDTPPEELEKTVARMKGELLGFNVTKPYKTDVIRLIDSDRSGCGAVNTVAVTADGAVGYNTDGYGFIFGFTAEGLVPTGGDVLVLGAGGAARVVVKELTEHGYRVFVHNRTAAKLEPLISEYKALPWRGGKADAIVNCTSFGLKSGENPLCALRGELAPKDYAFAYDLIYSPPETDFLKEARGRGAATANGLDMLIYQAIRADELILGTSFSASDYRSIAARIKALATK